MTLTNDFVNEQMANLRKVQVALWDQGFASEASAVRDVRNTLRTKRVDPNAPRTADQVRALFGEFTDAFGTSDQDVRHRFTQAVLGADVNPSWAGHGTLTVGQADRLLDVLAVVNER